MQDEVTEDAVMDFYKRGKCKLQAIQASKFSYSQVLKYTIKI